MEYFFANSVAVCSFGDLDNDGRIDAVVSVL